MPLTMQRRQALLGATITTTLLLAVGFGVLPRVGGATPSTVHVAAGTGTGTGTGNTTIGETPPASTDTQPPELASATASGPTPTHAPTDAPPVTTPPATAASSDSSAPSAPGPAGPARLPFGQRVNPSSADVQAAIGALHQRIPMFQPTEQQLRTFAEAVCASFDQGQTEAQVQSTVQDAVSRIEGATLSAADADFAVRTVVGLRCPGSL